MYCGVVEVEVEEVGLLERVCTNNRTPTAPIPAAASIHFDPLGCGFAGSGAFGGIGTLGVTGGAAVWPSAACTSAACKSATD